MLHLNCLGYEGTHSLGGFFLHLVGYVGVGVQGEACTVVTQDAGDGFGVYSLLDRQRGEGVPLWHNKFVQFLSVSTPSLCADKPWYFRIFSI